MQFAAGTIAESTKAFENFVRGTTGESQEPYTREQMAKDLLAFSPLGGISGAIGKGTAATLLRNTVGQANNPLRTGAPVVARTGREVDNIEPLARPSVPAVQTGVSSGQTTVPQSSSLLERLRALQTSPASPPRSTPVPAPTQSFPSSVPQQQAPASLMERLNALHTPQTIGPQSLPPTLRAPASQSTPPARLSDLPGIQPLPTISSRPQSAIGAPGEALQRLNSTAQELNEQFILLIRRLYQR
ncbi:hypothetical protein COU20_03105 [Candidatus Kaiserbacteria bacterium CG10_big_fil_rev_8_21_14_0_10_59_10]|uniref:Uncharacterized protein n=1 Tax=Candidatus Kaiserbacteria bacterium CG10_big_fil_rev_8_21_14_0_10_59_10 TaxID=1974612 RepID=A0A2H0U7A7_9BACT|nr:MAG: hypothetical protein COU20_03105 [Candidatus Kaiserbacteria bacterium CG10_big_fil_rev_8_21_14_0_10_59_10]